MNSLCWNCREPRNPRLVRALHDFVQCWDPRIVFLSKTKLRKRRRERVKDRLGFANGLIVPSRSHSGGLALLWTREINLQQSPYWRNSHRGKLLNRESQVFTVTLKRICVKNLGTFLHFLVTNATSLVLFRRFQRDLIYGRKIRRCH